MRENLAVTQKIFAEANSFEDLVSSLTPSLREQFGKNEANDVRVFLTINHLAVLGKRIFSFNDYRFQTWVEDGESLLLDEKVENMLDALTDVGIIYGDKKGRYFIRRKLYSKLSRLTDVYEKQELSKLLTI